MVKTRLAQAKQSRGWKLACLALTDAYTDFVLSRQAMNCTPATLGDSHTFEHGSEHIAIVIIPDFIFDFIKHSYL